MYKYENLRYRAKVWDNIEWRVGFVVLLWLLAMLTGKAQDRIEGIGKFKIGKTTDGIIQEVADELGTVVKTVNTPNELYGSYIPVVLRLGQKLDIMQNTSSSAPYCLNISVFYINKYKVADVDIQSLFLTFKDNILIRITADHSFKLKNTLTTKYGSGQEKEIYVKTNCPSTTPSIDPNPQGIKTLTTWENTDILAATYSEYYYDIDCRVRLRSGFFIEQVSKSVELNLCEKESEIRVQKGIVEKRKNALKDF